MYWFILCVLPNDNILKQHQNFFPVFCLIFHFVWTKFSTIVFQMSTHDSILQSLQYWFICRSILSKALWPFYCQLELILQSWITYLGFWCCSHGKPCDPITRVKAEYLILSSNIDGAWVSMDGQQHRFQTCFYLYHDMFAINTVPFRHFDVFYEEQYWFTFIWARLIK